MKLTLLGTSCSIPTKDRNTAGYFLQYDNYGILFDCGEGIQRQFKIAGLKLSKIDAIVLTHWHGDHSLGLSGVIQTLGSIDGRDTLDIYGPPGSKKYMKHLVQSIAFELKLDLRVHEVSEQSFLDKDPRFHLETLPMKHRVTCNAYRFVEHDWRSIDMKKVQKLGLKAGPWLKKIQNGETVEVEGKKISPEKVSTMQKGKVFTYITDTRPNPNAVKISRNATVLLIECVYDKSLTAKARKHAHLTAEQVGTIAKNAKVGTVVLTHFSSRYTDTKILADEVSSKYDGKVIAGTDFMSVDI